MESNDSVLDAMLSLETEMEGLFEGGYESPTETFRFVAAIIYGTLAAGGFLANLIFCLVIWKSEKLHTVTHMLMTNLAVCNLLFLLFHPPYFMTTYILETDWKFGTVICKTSFSIAYITVTGSFYFMSLVAVDRWLAIFQRKARLDRRKCVYLTAAAWLVSFLVAAPYLYLSRVIDLNANVESFFYELEAEKRCGADSPGWDRILLFLTIFVQYFIPLAIMVPIYSHLAVFLWRRPQIGVQSKEKTKRAHQRRRRLLITLIAIVAVLITCWSPLFSVGILHRLHPHDSFTPYVYTSMIALLGVLATPICYLINDGFRQQTILLLPCLRGRAGKSRHSPTTDRSTAAAQQQLLSDRTDRGSQYGGVNTGRDTPRSMCYES